MHSRIIRDKIDRFRDFSDCHLIVSMKSGSCLVTLNEAVDGSMAPGATNRD